MASAAPVTVVETPEFLVAARRLMDDEARAVLVDYLARNPTAGDVVPGAGGIRKLRWAMEGRGKRGGARVIYFFHSAELPVFALTAYAKSEQADLSQKDKNDFRQLTKRMVKSYGRRQP
jgi:hypothetical protein